MKKIKLFFKKVLQFLATCAIIRPSKGLKPKAKEDTSMKNTMTVTELIALLNKVEDKNTTIEFHSVSNRSYQDTVVEVETSKYTKRTTIIIK